VTSNAKRAAPRDAPASDVPRDAPARPAPRHVLIRALLAALALIFLAPAALIVLGGFVPGLPFVGRLGQLVIPYLPWLALTAAFAALLSGAAVALGGRRGAGVLLAASLLTLGGTVFATAELAGVANEHGASFSLVRQLGPDPAPRHPDWRVTYLTVEGGDLHAEVWEPPNRAANPAALGAGVLFIHGGGFWGGTLESRPALFAALADAGFPVVDVEYRISPPPRWSQAPGDALCALTWLEKNGPTYGIDASKIVVVGESAGGNLALVAAYSAGTAKVPSSCGGEPAPPAAVVAISPTADLAGMWQDASLSLDGVVFPEAYVGGTPAQFPDRYAQASPMWLIRKDVPPTLILAGAIDHLVHLERTTIVSDQLRSAGADSTLVVVPFADHGFDGPPNAFGQQLEDQLLPAFIRAHT
jgi:acetyl esterase